MRRAFFTYFFLFILCVSAFADTGDIVCKSLSRIVNHRYGDDYDVKINVQYLPDVIRKNEEKAVVSPAKDARLYGKTIIPVYFENKKYNVIVSISLFKKVYVAAENIARGDVLSIDNLEKKYIDVTSFFKHLPADGFVEVKHEAKKTIVKDSVILKKMIVQKYAARVGEEVTVVAKKGRVTVECSGKMLVNAYLNDEVMVENLTSHKKLKGVLVRPGVVFLKKYLR